MNKLQEYCKFISTAEIEKVTAPKIDDTVLLLYLKDAPLAPNSEGYPIRPSIVCNTKAYDYKPTLVLDWNNAIHEWSETGNEEDEIRFYPAFAEKYGDILFKYDGQDGSDVVLDIEVEHLGGYDNPEKDYSEIELYRLSFGGHTLFLHSDGENGIQKVSLTEDGECILDKPFDSIQGASTMTPSSIFRKKN